VRPAWRVLGRVLNGGMGKRNGVMWRAPKRVLAPRRTRGVDADELKAARAAVLDTYVPEAFTPFFRRAEKQPAFRDFMASFAKRYGVGTFAVFAVTVLLRPGAWTIAAVGAICVAFIGIYAFVARYVANAAAHRVDVQRFSRIAIDADADAEGRKLALEKHDTSFDPKEAAPAFARAEFLRYEDPEGALASLERIDPKRRDGVTTQEIQRLRVALCLALDRPARARAVVEEMLAPLLVGRRLEEWLTPRAELAELTAEESDALDAFFTKDARSAALSAEVLARIGSTEAARMRHFLDRYGDRLPNLEKGRPCLLRAQAFLAAALDDHRGVRAAVTALEDEAPELVTGLLTLHGFDDLEDIARELRARASGTFRGFRPT
jgi:hypothetical protein